MPSSAAQTEYPPGEQVAELSRQILHTSRAQDVEEDGSLAIIPSERMLAEQLGVNRYAIRKALDLLERSGQARRLANRGMVVVDQPEASPQKDGMPLRSITFVLGSALEATDMQWLVQYYLVAYTAVLEPYHIRTRFISWNDQQQDYENLLWPQAPWNTQACLLVSIREPKLLHWLSDNHIPYVVQNHAVYCKDNLPEHHSVCVNKAGGIFEATRKLLELGHRRIGFIGPVSDRHGVCFEYDGYVAAMHSAGLALRSADALNFITQVTELAVEPARQYLARPDRPTAVVTASGALALGMLQAADALGLRVPEDLSVVGLSSYQTQDHPQLSTIDVPRRRLAHTSLSMLMDSVLGSISIPLTKVLNCRLQLRSSTGPAAADDMETAQPVITHSHS